MKALWNIIKLELLANLRSRAFFLLTSASVLWMLVMPSVVKSDGTDEGARQLYVHYSLGGVFALVLVSLAAAAAGSLSRDRAAKRLQLTMVRPVRYFLIAAGRYLALLTIGAAELVLAAGILACKTDASRPCDHVLSPILPSVWEEAEDMYEVYMNDVETPKEVRAMSKEDVVALLAAKAPDHYQTVGTNETASWEFAYLGTTDKLRVQLRFTNMYDTREDVNGRFSLGQATGAVSNITQAVAKVPLSGVAGPSDGLARVLAFENHGGSSVMLRPRRDIQLLVEADSLACNLTRATLELVAMLSVALAFAIFLGASLGRSVAVFAVITMLVLTALTPSVVADADEFASEKMDRIGYRIAKFTEKFTRPLGALEPLEKLANDVCVERAEVVRVMILNLGVYPLLLLMLSALVIPRKQDGL